MVKERFFIVASMAISLLMFAALPSQAEAYEIERSIAVASDVAPDYPFDLLDVRADAEVVVERFTAYSTGGGEAPFETADVSAPQPVRLTNVQARAPPGFHMLC